MSSSLPSSSSSLEVKVTRTVGSAPIGIKLLKLTGYQLFETRTFYKVSVLFLTFISYASYHLSRRPPSVVKSILNKNCTDVPIPSGINVTKDNLESWCDWERKFYLSIINIAVLSLYHSSFRRPSWDCSVGTYGFILLVQLRVLHVLQWIFS